MKVAIICSLSVFQPQQRPEPPPSPSLSLRERMGSLKRIISPGQRPLPDTPTTTAKPAGLPVSRPPSRPTTPTSGNHNPFDAIQKPPSITMEKIKNHTSATLDRMSILQQRYRQHQEIMRSSGVDLSRRTSNTSQGDIDAMVSKS